MGPYNHHPTHFYDPVGSQANQQPTIYTYQEPPATSSAFSLSSSNTPTNYDQNYGTSTYGNHQYGSGSANHNANSSASRVAASALSNLNNSPSACGQSTTYDSTGEKPYDNSRLGSASYNFNNDAFSANANANANNLHVPSRPQSTTAAPTYPSQVPSSATFDRSNITEQTQSSTSTYGAQSYENQIQSDHSRCPPSYAQPTLSTPQRQQSQSYNSPLHAVKAQQQSPRGHGHSQQPFKASNGQPSPRMNEQHQLNRQHSASAEPLPMTVDPSQIYDVRAEQQRNAQIAEEKRRKREVEEAKRKAEEERIAARIEEEKARFEQEQADTEAAKKRKVEQEAAAKQAAEQAARQEAEKAAEKKRSQTTAAALQQMASRGSDIAGPSDTPGLTDEEKEMRAMFQKMREFNAKNPKMLAKLWEEERRTHALQSPRPSSTVQTPAPAPAPAALQMSGQGVNTTRPPSSGKQPLSVQPGGSRTANTPTIQAPSVRPGQKPAPSSVPKTVAKLAAKPTAKTTIPMTPQASGAESMWPPHKKGVISEAAATWLMAIPENVGKVVRKDDVLKILDSNPAYVQLCKALEDFGLKFERSLLARELLKAVPDGSKAQSIQKTIPDTPALDGVTRVNGTPGMNQMPANSSSGRAIDYHRSVFDARPPSNNGTVNYEASRFTLTEAVLAVNKVDKPVHAPLAINGSQLQASPYFAPVVQTPTHVNNGSHPPSQPAAQAPAEPVPTSKPPAPPWPPANKKEEARKRTFGDLVDLTATDSDDEGPLMKKPMMQPPPLLDQQTPAKKINWPGMGMPAQFVAPPITNLAPIRPSSVAPAPAKSKGPTPEQLQQERMKRKMLVEPIMRDRVARKNQYDPRTIARDVLIATGRHPDMRTLNQHLMPMQKLLGDHSGAHETDGTRGLRSDLSTIRWDIIDPEPEPTDAGPLAQATTLVKAGATAKNVVDESANDKKDALAVSDHQRGPQSTAPQQTDVPTVKMKVGRRRKRLLPEAANAESLTAGKGKRASSANMTGIGTPVRQTPSATSTSRNSPAMSSSGPVGYAAFRKYDADGNPIKTKGRPLGWKKNIHSREAQGLAPISSGAKRPTAVKNSKVKSSGLVEAEYQIYKCEWEECVAELHNLETLKKHVIKIHGDEDEDGVYKCLWNKCGKHFSEFEVWTGHVCKEHTNPIAWKLGDGPKAGRIDAYSTDTEAYLSDAQGRFVTPMISGDSPAAKRTSDSDLQALIDHKRVVGPTFEKMGCTLANAKRRRGFLEDENFELFYDEEDDRF